MADNYATRLARLDCCAISDALDQLQLPSSVTGIGRLSAPSRVSGQVITVKLAAGSPPADAPPRHLCTTAIDQAEPGQVVVVEQLTGIECAGWGGILSNAAGLRGISGVIVEGLARDIDEADDWVVADGSGVAFIPADRIEDVLSAAERIAAKEAGMTKVVLAGHPVSQVMGASYEHLLENTGK